MGETAAETLTEIASARDALERDISTLTERVPPKEQLVKGAAVGGGGLAGLVALFALIAKVVSHRREERELRHEAEVHAEAVADELSRRAAVVAEDGHLRVDLDLDERDGGSGGGFLAALVALLAGFAAAFAWMRRGRPLDDEVFERADPQDTIEPDLATGGGLPSRPAGTTPTSSSGDGHTTS